MIDKPTELQAKRTELDALSDAHVAAVKEMEAAKVVLDGCISKVSLLNEKLARANEEYVRLELAAT